MSVRRLAESSVQPATFAFTAENAAFADETIRKYPVGRQQSAVIPLLMRAQEQEGWVTKAAIETIATMLDMPFIRVLEVATFYTQYQLKPVGTRAHVQVCGTTPCMIRGSEALMDVCRSKIHHEQFHTNASGTLSWEEVECLGACVNAPMVMIFKDTYEDLTPARLTEIIDAFEAGKANEVKPGPQIDRIYSAPATGLTSLKDERVVLKSTRDAERAEAAKAAANDADLPPSNAGRPKTDAPETNPAIESPAPVKSSQAAEAAASVAPPAHDATAANAAEPRVEGDAAQRKGAPDSDEPAPYKAPELLKGEPIGPAGKRVEADADQQGRPGLQDAARPAGIERPGSPDRLTLISGIGPKIEATLHSLGIYTFAQIAGWSEAEREWVDGYLNFKGRIERDGWLKQADALSRGGVDEYVRVFGKKPV